MEHLPANETDFYFSKAGEDQTRAKRKNTNNDPK